MHPHPAGANDSLFDTTLTRIQYDANMCWKCWGASKLFIWFYTVKHVTDTLLSDTHTSTTYRKHQMACPIFFGFCVVEQVFNTLGDILTWRLHVIDTSRKSWWHAQLFFDFVHLGVHCWHAGKYLVDTLELRKMIFFIFLFLHYK